MTGFLSARQIRIFDYPRFAEPLRDRVRDRAAELAGAAGLTIEHISKNHIRKEEVVAKVLAVRGDHPGLVHIISAMEACDTYKPWHLDVVQTSAFALDHFLDHGQTPRHGADAAAGDPRAPDDAIVDNDRRRDIDEGKTPGLTVGDLLEIEAGSGPLQKFGDWTIEIVKRAADAAGFRLLPRRWVIERIFARLNRSRRLAKVRGFDRQSQSMGLPRLRAAAH